LKIEREMGLAQIIIISIPIITASEPQSSEVETHFDLVFCAMWGNNRPKMFRQVEDVKDGNLQHY